MKKQDIGFQAPVMQQLSGLEKNLNYSLPMGQVTLKFCLPRHYTLFPRFSNLLNLYQEKTIFDTRVKLTHCRHEVEAHGLSFDNGADIRDPYGYYYCRVRCGLVFKTKATRNR